jgi:hypothetical protein
MCDVRRDFFDVLGRERECRLGARGRVEERRLEEDDGVEGHWKGWKEFRERMGRGEIELGGCFSPMELSTTVVDDVSLRLRLNINKTIGELLRELKIWENLLSSLPQFSTRDGVSWISHGFNVDNFWRNG